MNVRIPKKIESSGYDAQLRAYDNEQYNNFFESCKVMRKSHEELEAARGKAMLEGYKLFKKQGIPFGVANQIFPALCKVMSDYEKAFAKYHREHPQGVPGSANE